MAVAKKAVPDGYHTVTPSLTLENAAKAIDWYKDGLGAREVSRHAGAAGEIMHAEIEIGNSRIMLQDPIMGAKGPKAIGGSPASLWVYVEDCDALFNRAVGAGAETLYPVADQFWGDRCGSVKDPHGYTWTFATRKEELTPEELQQRQAEFMKQLAQPS